MSTLKKLVLAAVLLAIATAAYAAPTVMHGPYWTPNPESVTLVLAGIGLVALGTLARKLTSDQSQRS